MGYKVGLDVSGGDKGISEILKGAILASSDKSIDAEIVLIGHKNNIDIELAKLKKSNEFTIIDAPEIIDMGESPVAAVRRKRKSSIVLGINALKDGAIDAFVSCGNTGAVVSASTLTLRTIPGVERPGIAVPIPTRKGITILMDGGANIMPKPLHFFQYGVMSAIYSEIVFNKNNVEIGLLNIGEEESKGSDSVKKIYKLFSESTLNFIGNVEPKGLFSGECDCIVCDGFAGNIALKVAEGAVEIVGRFIKDLVKKNPIAILGVFLLSGTIKKLRRKVDYAEYGGAPLLGVNGIVIIGHGRSNAVAVKNAVKTAVKELSHDINGEIERKINAICQDSRIREILT
ncbi:MAG: phosphate acyltransferase PlsX [Candidatus Omnitrophica bacterium]|nr:phosphate acyltransferase PlsX [Candidatus Omnitrophota bacterium]